MKFSHFFIDRPIFAMVLSIVIVIVGGLSYFALPIAQYPDIVPPTVVVSAQYPGASAQVAAETVATPIEQQLNGLEGMIYMQSQSSGDGRVSITVSFRSGTDVQDAQVLVQNRVAAALPRLPDQVRNIGVVTDKASPDIMMVVQIYSPKATRDPLYLSNFALLRLQDRLARIKGVGNVRIGGARDYSMRIWLDPDRMGSLNLAAEDVVRALRAENTQVASGTLGQPPVGPGNAIELKLNLLGRLKEPEQFENIIVKTGEDGRFTRLRDVARIELGALDYLTAGFLDGQPAIVLLFAQQPGSNAVDAAEEIKKTLAELRSEFPEDVEYLIGFNPVQYISESISELNKTIFEAVALVVLVVLIFLQSWRAAIIPVAAIPVSLVGTFAVMAAFGYGINNLTLFGLVLAVGIVVDDAIVVVENMERNLRDGLAPREAARKTMDEVGSALISIALVLSAVFVPTAFLAGITGEFYRQFAVTVAVATIISTFNSLTLSPALGAMLLRSHNGDQSHGAFPWAKYTEAFAVKFNRFFDASSTKYAAFIGRITRRQVRMLTIYVGLIALAALGFASSPVGFIPMQDRGYFITAVALPEGSSLERTRDMMLRATKVILETPGVEHAVAFAGFSGATRTNATNVGTIFVPLKSFDERLGEGLTGPVVMASLRKRLSQFQEANIVVLNPPTIMGLGNSGGFQMMVEDRNNVGPRALAEVVQTMVATANKTPGLQAVFSPWEARTPQLFVDVDRTRAQILQVPVSSIFSALETYLGATYVNDFNILGRTYRVMAEGESRFRMSKDDIARIRMRSTGGDMVPLGSLVTFREVAGPDRVPHFNLYATAEVKGDAAPGYSSGQALDAMEKLAAELLPEGFAFEWTEMAYQEKLASGSGSLMIFALAVLFVFLALSAQYESWSLPLTVILIVPMCLLSAIGGILLRGMDNNVFTQIGFVVLVGLAAKNAILIVEFARQLEDAGKDRFAAAVESCRLRLRPILMTSLAFIFGVIPLAIGEGAGAEMRQALGTGVFFGMLGVTAFGLIFTPVFYVVVRGWVTKDKTAPALEVKPAE
jgi:hydrophobe/amphiphile efflux-1 (HAE1) family protein